MKIQVLVENKSESPHLEKQDGLSLYIQTQHHKILFDMGLDSLFIENAKKLNINLSQVDIAILSHGHYDHGGGLQDFLDINKKAAVYINKKAFGDFYSIKNGEKRYAGLDKGLKYHERITFLDGDYTVDDNLKLISDIKPCDIMELQNSNLYEKKDNAFVRDMFDHEQALFIRENKCNVLITGCSHKGIVNIMQQVSAKENVDLDYVIGGFHLKRITDEGLIKNDIGTDLKRFKAKYYAGHCTGAVQFNQLSEVLGDRIQSLFTGSHLQIKSD
ncbi:MAG: MBL fold metallo-hydrolase [Clostridiales bacterium]|nr:MBL fold metallo-hydrolase [Clostridiales bacterium]